MPCFPRRSTFRRGPGPNGRKAGRWPTGLRCRAAGISPPWSSRNCWSRTCRRSFARFGSLFPCARSLQRSMVLGFFWRTTMRQTNRSFLVVLVLLLCSFAVQTTQAQLPLKLRVQAGDREREDAVVMLQMPAGQGGGALRLHETTGGQESPVAVQFEAQAGKLWWVAGGTTAAGATRTYRLEKGEAGQGASVSVVDTGATVEARFNGKPLLRYNKAHVEPGEGIDPKYGRSGHLHPVWTPGGAVVTDELPPDHLHQSGIFLAHTRTQFEGRNVDFWNLAGGKGRVRFKELKETISGPVFGQLQTVQEHVDLTAS